MSALLELQRQFQDHVLRGEHGIAARIVDGPRAGRSRRLAIYVDAYRLRLVEALGNDFEALQTALGADQFKRLCLDYIEATPSTFRNLRWYGGGLAQFLRDAQPWSQRPWLAEVAQFEWTLTLAFDAPDSAALRFEELASVAPDAWPDLAFVMHPSLHRLELHSNAPALRKALEERSEIPEIVMQQQTVHWIVWRQDYASYFRSLDEAEAWALQAAADGGNFAALCEGLCRWVEAEGAPLRAAGMLRGWIDDQLLAGLVQVPPPEVKPV